MMNDECGMMNEMKRSHTAARPGAGHHSSFLVPHLGGGSIAGWND
jgi:hypothetical protein